MAMPQEQVRSVDSFSQLPFIRQAAVAAAPARDTTIRLFGHEFSNNNDERHQQHKESSGAAAGSPEYAANNNTTNGSTVTSDGGSGGKERKFECHYCCRNFPTSQALGGHQNAHKRERQHAKRAHLQASLAAMHHHHHRYAAVPAHHMYGALLGYPPPPPAHYPMWTTTAAAGPPGSAYGLGPGSMAQPIDGSPVQGLWGPRPTHTFAGPHGPADLVPVRRPATAGHDQMAFKVDDEKKAVVSFLSTSPPSLSSCSSTSAPEKLLAAGSRCELGQQRQEAVISLDLHL